MSASITTSGHVVVADDDGVVVVPATELAATLIAGEKRRPMSRKRGRNWRLGYLGWTFMKCVQHLRTGLRYVERLEDA
jgi:4-hydroxy-4-methyl-2-oxoglutarate aldolase